MSSFLLNEKNHLKRNMFFDGSVDIARYDSVKYPQFEKLTEQQMGYYWRPQEVDCSKSGKDFKLLSEEEKHIFTSNLKRQILLDSIQGRAPTLAFLPICSLPELENWIQVWTFFETIHSRSYTHIIRNVYSDPSKIFDDMMEIKEIVDCAKDISKYYDDLIEANNIQLYKQNPYEHKKKLWLALNAVNALEGIRFYVSFACSWNFAEMKKMEANAKIIKFIARDENIHLAATQQILKLLPKEDIEYENIKNECETEVINMFNDVVNQEKEWAKYIFQYGSMVGLNEELFSVYVDWIANKRMNSIGLKSQYKSGSNPLPWTQKWISGSEVQVAPQEVEISSYIVGGLNNDLNMDNFLNFKL